MLWMKYLQAGLLESTCLNYVSQKNSTGETNCLSRNTLLVPRFEQQNNSTTVLKHNVLLSLSKSNSVTLFGQGTKLKNITNPYPL